MFAGKILGAVALCVVALPVSGLAEDWTRQTDGVAGYRYSYPPAVFSPIPGDGKPSFHYFASPDDEAKLLVGAWNNEAGETPGAFKRWLMDNAGGYDAVTYHPRGKSWFVLSGYRDDLIYYEKVMFSCGGSLVNVLAVSYPTAERSFYDPIVERMENAFHPARNC